ncbi:MAG: aquaporin [Acidimicrobiales bacterium]
MPLPATPLGPSWGGCCRRLRAFAAYALIGGISGGHFNPAVSAGLAMAKRIDLGALPVYWGGQFFGAVAAVFGVLAVARGRVGRIRCRLTNFGANAYGHDLGFSSLAPSPWPKLA